MVCARTYSRDEVNLILTQSEGRAVGTNPHGGHTRERHIGQTGNAISDRLMGTAKSSAQFPIVMDATGKIADSATTRSAWTSGHNHDPSRGALPTNAKGTGTGPLLKKLYERSYDNGVSASGSFYDFSQAVVLIRFALNSPTGQTQLARLDTGAETRVEITTGLNNLEAADGAWKMHASSVANDVTHVSDIKAVTVIVDHLVGAPGEIHIQTAYPSE